MPTWTAHRVALADEPTLKLTISSDGAPLSFGGLLQGWRQDEAFAAWYGALLAGMPYAAYGWEMPALTSSTLQRPCEFIVRDFPALQTPPDDDAFAEHFGAAGDGIVEFANLGRDAWLVAPQPLAAAPTYTHLAAFVRGAPSTQQRALWSRIGAAAERLMSERPLWISTHGGGVAWLHVRLEGRPKYYEHAPYRVP